MTRFLLLLTIFTFCISCNKQETEIKSGSSVATPWSWRTPQARPLILSGDVSTFAGFPGGQGALNGIGHYASFMSPQGIATDGTSLYITDYLDSTVRRVNIATQEVTHFAGQSGVYGDDGGIGSAASFKSLWMITTDGASLFITDQTTIRKINIATREVTTLAGLSNAAGSVNGIGSAARFDEPTGITTDGTNLYVAEGGNHTIRKIVIATGEVTTLAGSAGVSGSANGTGSNARFNYPFAITTDGTYIYVVDTNNNTIRKIEISTQIVTTLAGDALVPAAHADGIGRFAHFNEPFGITDDGTNLYVTETSGCTVRKIVKATSNVTTISGSNEDCSILDGVGTAARHFLPFSITTDGSSLFLVEEAVIRKIQ